MWYSVNYLILGDVAYQIEWKINYKKYRFYLILYCLLGIFGERVLWFAQRSREMDVTKGSLEMQMAHLRLTEISILILPSDPE